MSWQSRFSGGAEPDQRGLNALNLLYDQYTSGGSKNVHSLRETLKAFNGVWSSNPVIQPQHWHDVFVSAFEVGMKETPCAIQASESLAQQLSEATKKVYNDNSRPLSTATNAVLDFWASNSEVWGYILKLLGNTTSTEVSQACHGKLLTALYTLQKLNGKKQQACLEPHAAQFAQVMCTHLDSPSEFSRSIAAQCIPFSIAGNVVLHDALSSVIFVTICASIFREAAFAQDFSDTIKKLLACILALVKGVEKITQESEQGYSYCQEASPAIQRACFKFLCTGPVLDLLYTDQSQFFQLMFGTNVPRKAGIPNFLRLVLVDSIVALTEIATTYVDDQWNDACYPAFLHLLALFLCPGTPVTLRITAASVAQRQMPAVRRKPELYALGVPIVLPDTPFSTYSIDQAWYTGNDMFHYNVRVFQNLLPGLSNKPSKQIHLFVYLVALAVDTGDDLEAKAALSQVRAFLSITNISDQFLSALQFDVGAKAFNTDCMEAVQGYLPASVKPAPPMDVNIVNNVMWAHMKTSCGIVRDALLHLNTPQIPQGYPAYTSEEIVLIKYTRSSRALDLLSTAIHFASPSNITRSLTVNLYHREISLPPLCFFQLDILMQDANAQTSPDLSRMVMVPRPCPSVVTHEGEAVRVGSAVDVLQDNLYQCLRCVLELLMRRDVAVLETQLQHPVVQSVQFRIVTHGSQQVIDRFSREFGYCLSVLPDAHQVFAADLQSHVQSVAARTLLTFVDIVVSIRTQTPHTERLTASLIAYQQAPCTAWEGMDLKGLRLGCDTLTQYSILCAVGLEPLQAQLMFNRHQLYVDPVDHIPHSFDFEIVSFQRYNSLFLPNVLNTVSQCWYEWKQIQPLMEVLVHRITVFHLQSGSAYLRMLNGASPAESAHVSPRHLEPVPSSSPDACNTSNSNLYSNQEVEMLRNLNSSLESKVEMQGLLIEELREDILAFRKSKDGDVYARTQEKLNSEKKKLQARIELVASTVQGRLIEVLGSNDVGKHLITKVDQLQIMLNQLGQRYAESESKCFTLESENAVLRGTLDAYSTTCHSSDGMYAGQRTEYEKYAVMRIQMLEQEVMKLHEQLQQAPVHQYRSPTQYDVETVQSMLDTMHLQRTESPARLEQQIAAEVQISEPIYEQYHNTVTTAVYELHNNNNAVDNVVSGSSTIEDIVNQDDFVASEVSRETVTLTDSVKEDRKEDVPDVLVSLQVQPQPQQQPQQEQFLVQVQTEQLPVDLYVEQTYQYHGDKHQDQLHANHNSHALYNELVHSDVISTSNANEPEIPAYDNQDNTYNFLFNLDNLNPTDALVDGIPTDFHVDNALDNISLPTDFIPDANIAQPDLELYGQFTVPEQPQDHQEEKSNNSTSSFTFHLPRQDEDASAISLPHINFSEFVNVSLDTSIDGDRLPAYMPDTNINLM